MQDGLTALHHAIIGKREAVISHLLRKGANPQARDLVRNFLIYIYINFDFNTIDIVCILITGWCCTASLCCSSRSLANCQTINEIQG